MGWNARRRLCFRVLHRAHDASFRCFRAVAHHYRTGKPFGVPSVCSPLTPLVMSAGQRRQFAPRTATPALPIRRGNTLLPRQQRGSYHHLQHQEPNRNGHRNFAGVGFAFGYHCDVVDYRVPEERGEEGTCGAGKDRGWQGMSGEGTAGVIICRVL